MTINAIIVKIATALPVTCDQIGSETACDPVLSVVFKYVHLGWPPKGTLKTNPAIEPYFKLRDHFSILGKCLMFASRVVIPASLRKEVLELIHIGHPGIVRSLMLARSFCWWSKMDDDISNMVSNCQICAQVNFALKAKYIPWPEAKQPFERVHIDFYVKSSLSYFILCDSFSKWLHVSYMPKTDARHVIEVLMAIFALFGSPKMLVSDNGQPFDSNLFAEFCTNFNVQILHSPPYSPESNGLAERCVSIAKKGMEKIILSLGSDMYSTPYDSSDIHTVNMRLSKFLYNYRNTPTTTTRKTPNELLLSFAPRTLLSQLVPTSNTVDIRASHYREGERVKFKLNERSPTVNATIVRVNGTRYLVSVDGVLKEVHHNQLSRAPL